MGSERVTGGWRRSERLTGSKDFQAVFRQGTRIERPSLVLLCKASGRARRVGFAVSRQMQGAVERNRARRRLREAYRAARAAAPASADLVLVARRGALTAPFGALVLDVRAALGAAAQRVGQGRPA